MLLAVRTSSYGCTWVVWRALKKLELLSAAPRATLTLLSCSPNFLRASVTRYTHAKHETILKQRLNLTSWLVLSFLAFITFMIPLADLATCGDDPKSLTQLAKNEVYFSGIICSLVETLRNQFCHPVSARQNDWASGVVRNSLCELQTPVIRDDAHLRLCSGLV